MLFCDRPFQGGFCSVIDQTEATAPFTGNVSDANPMANSHLSSNTHRGIPANMQGFGPPGHQQEDCKIVFSYLVSSSS